MKERKLILNNIYSKPSEYWEDKMRNTVLKVSREAFGSVPAYKDFLKTKANIKQINTYKDFLSLPPTDKNTYLKKFSWEHLIKNKSLSRESLVLTSTSGSTGAPFYFPRSDALDEQSAVYHEMFLRNLETDSSKSTLVIVCFGMGVWIGGLITYQAFKKISLQGFPLTIITPGVNKKEIYSALKNLAPKYDQIIMCGYPPFMKDLVDEANDNGVRWTDHDVKMVFAAESFSENFRDYIIKKIGIADPYRSTTNVYGSADLGTMAQETPVSILIRRFALKNKKLYLKLFGDATRLPTLAQFIPNFVVFEEVQKEIYCTGDNVLPLVRYKIGDNGGVLSYSKIKKIFEDEGFNLKKEITKAGILSTVSELPFVYVYERSDFSTKLYGAIIYPEYIKESMCHRSLQRYVTGKFTMFTNHDKDQNEHLEVHIELKPGIGAADHLESKIVKLMVEILHEKSAEYKYLFNLLGDKVKPKIILWPHSHGMYFSVGIKQKWVRRV